MLFVQPIRHKADPVAAVRGVAIGRNGIAHDVPSPHGVAPPCLCPQIISLRERSCVSRLDSERQLQHIALSRALTAAPAVSRATKYTAARNECKCELS